MWKYIKFELNQFNAHRLLSGCVQGNTQTNTYIIIVASGAILSC